MPLRSPAKPLEVGVNCFDIFVSFEFSRDRHCHAGRKCRHRVSSDNLLRVAVRIQWRTNSCG